MFFNVCKTSEPSSNLELDILGQNHIFFKTVSAKHNCAISLSTVKSQWEYCFAAAILYYPAHTGQNARGDPNASSLQ